MKNLTLLVFTIVTKSTWEIQMKEKTLQKLLKLQKRNMDTSEVFQIPPFLFCPFEIYFLFFQNRNN